MHALPHGPQFPAHEKDVGRAGDRQVPSLLFQAWIGKWSLLGEKLEVLLQPFFGK